MTDHEHRSDFEKLFRSRHWLTVDDARNIVGCHCGFQAEQERDCGYGDSVLEHLHTAAMDEAIAAIEAREDAYADPGPFVAAVRALRDREVRP